MNKKITCLYFASQGIYWMCNCAVIGYASMMMLSRGFSSALAGTALAGGHILGIFSQQIFANLASRGFISLQKLSMLIAVAGAVLYGLFFFIPNAAFLVVGVFFLTDAMVQAVQPFLNSLGIYYINRNYKLNYGIARSMGSISYAVISSVFGTIVGIWGIKAVMACGVAFLLLLAVVFFLMPVLDDVKPSEAGKEADNLPQPVGSWGFVVKYKAFMAMLAGVMLFSIFMNFTGSYLYQITTSLNGTTTQMGMAMSIGALSELPTMILCASLIKRFGSKNVLKVAMVFYAVKALGFYLAPNMNVICGVQVLQMLSFALYTPTSVYFVNEVIELQDRIMGQAFITAAATLGGVAANFAGGFIIDRYNVHTLLLVGFICAAAGAVLVIIFCGKCGIRRARAVAE